MKYGIVSARLAVPVGVNMQHHAPELQSRRVCLAEVQLGHKGQEG